MIEIYKTFFDSVINSNVSIGQTNYRQALEMFLPLIDRFDAQRKLQNRKFYDRLKRDILVGCVMPPITVAIISEEFSNPNKSEEQIKRFVNHNMSEGYILDGMQRMNTLRSASEEFSFDGTKELPLSVIVAPSEDQLVYRMITLNNGQKPMTARHQIEILTSSIFSKRNFENISIRSEKDTEGKRYRNALSLATVSKGYIAHMTGSISNDNKKIIDEKMDEILVGRILERGASIERGDFNKIIRLVDSLCQDERAFHWFKVENNLIGFCAAIEKSYSNVCEVSPEDFSNSIASFDDAFDSFNPSKLNVGRTRRQLVFEFISNYSKLSDLSELDLLEHFSDYTSS